jgi:hypothetical protein
MSPKKEKSGVFHVLRVWKTLKGNSKISFFIKQSDETEKEINYRSTYALSNTLMSVKIIRSLDNIFMFRESEKSLKGTPGGSFFI